MNKRLLYALTLFIVSLFSLQLKGQDEVMVLVGNETKKTVVDSISRNYSDWKELSMSGKLSSPLFSMSPSVKVYMERGKVVIISVSVFLAGEVARIEIDKDGALLVNKWSNTYTTVSSAQMESVCPGGLEAFQDLLLGRITILGSGELSNKNADQFELYDLSGYEWLILPNQDFDNGKFLYVYFADINTYKLDRFMVLAREGLGNVDVSYEWGKKEMTMNWEAEISSGMLQATLKLNYPDYSPKKIARIELGSQYKKVDLRGVLKL